MIKINSMSLKIHDVMVKRFKISPNTSARAWVLHLSALWREADAALNEKECSRFIYSGLELVLADMILLCLAALRSLGVRNVENLLRRRLEESDKEDKIKR